MSKPTPANQPPAPPTPPETTPSASGAESPKRDCRYCGEEVWFPKDRACYRCESRIELAREFCYVHFKVPEMFRAAVLATRYERGSYLFVGPAGSGKTHTAYALLQAWRKADPRMKIAAYSWPVVLMELRRSYNKNEGEAARADRIIDALRGAHAILIDDLGAEKVTDENLGWIREILFVILDERWSQKRLTLMTSNYDGRQLANYLGERIASRVVGMAESVEMKGRDWRLEKR